jgi:uncharacterized protein
MISPLTAEKLERLRAAFTEKGRVLIALSGGVDSAVCMAVAHETLGFENAVAVTAKSETLTPTEFAWICELARERGWNHRTIEYSELEIPNYAANPVNRCFFCKHELYGRLGDLAREWGFAAVVEGTNFSDLGDYRPGIEAASQRGTFAPLLLCEIAKDEVREIAREVYELPNWAKPSGACLSSRFPYGKQITREGIDRVAAAEDFLHELGFTQVRVRHHENLARIELLPDEIPRLFADGLNERVTKRLRQIGFPYVTLDLAGYRTGSMNEVITGSKAEPASR